MGEGGGGGAVAKAKQGGGVPFHAARSHPRRPRRSRARAALQCCHTKRFNAGREKTRGRGAGANARRSGWRPTVPRGGVHPSPLSRGTPRAGADAGRRRENNAKNIISAKIILYALFSPKRCSSVFAKSVWLEAEAS